MQHLVIHFDAKHGDIMDWDWPFKVDWMQMQNLKTLQLDLRAFSRLPSEPATAQVVDLPVLWEGLEGGAESMAYL